MVILGGILFVAVIFALFFLWRWAGRMQKPSAGERVEHSAQKEHDEQPRATGLN